MVHKRDFISHHAPALFDRAEECQRYKQGVATVVLCVSSIEAMLNDLCEWYRFVIKHESTCPNLNPNSNKLFGGEFNETCVASFHYITKEEKGVFNLLETLESERKSLECKIEEIFKFSGNKAPKGDLIWQDFKTLVEIRNGIVHAKGEHLSQENPLSDERRSGINGYPDFVGRLMRRGFIGGSHSLDRGGSWFELVERNEKFLSWCLDATRKFATILLRALPDSNVTDIFIREAAFYR
ncbi:hypothetical protein [Chromobacterium sp. ASV23]|uniref:hypothetical protein n=1 Tax=Chromobacterium sp. ASV23 TaxID=2795110 RepID=UPI0018ED5608|nr:hypothetical protein [Chromobacterium sp. ASV23]